MSNVADMPLIERALRGAEIHRMGVVAVHEAGHAVVGLYFGVPLKWASIVPPAQRPRDVRGWDSSEELGGTKHDWAAVDAMEEYPWHPWLSRADVEATICLAGRAAESKFFRCDSKCLPKATIEYLDEGAESDIFDAKQSFMHARIGEGITYPIDHWLVQASFKKAHQRAVRIVNKRWGDILTFADRLLVEKTVVYQK